MDEDYSATIARIASLSEPERINKIANIITGIDDVLITAKIQLANS